MLMAASPPDTIADRVAYPMHGAVRCVHIIMLHSGGS
jgi:hypothetical protein